MMRNNPHRFYQSSVNKLNQFQYQLKQINPNPERICDQSYLLSNEAGWHTRLTHLNSLSLSDKSHSTCILLTGESYCLSALPIFAKFGKIIFNDVDQTVHNNIQLMLKVIKQAKCKEEFIEQYYYLAREQNDEYIASDLYQYKKNLEHRKNELREFDFLHSPERYLMCQRAARAAKIFYSHCNLFDKNHIRQFSHILDIHGFRLTLMNISNVRNYDVFNQLSESLKNLSHHNPIILHSEHIDKQTITALPLINYNEYMNELSQSNTYKIIR